MRTLYYLYRENVASLKKIGPLNSLYPIEICLLRTLVESSFRISSNV